MWRSWVAPGSSPLRVPCPLRVLEGHKTGRIHRPRVARVVLAGYCPVIREVSVEKGHGTCLDTNGAPPDPAFVLIKGTAPEEEGQAPTITPPTHLYPGALAEDEAGDVHSTRSLARRVVCPVYGHEYDTVPVAGRQRGRVVRLRIVHPPLQNAGLGARGPAGPRDVQASEGHHSSVFLLDARHVAHYTNLGHEA